MTNIKHILKTAFFLLIIWLSSCSEEPEVNCDESDLEILVNQTLPSECNGATGSISVSGSEGAGGYTFSIDGASFQESGLFEGLAAGSYTVVVQDANNCQVSQTVSVSDQTNMTLDIAVSAAGCNSSEGSISIAVDGGEAPYSYSVDGGGFQENNTFEGLQRGIYIATARDAEGCSVSGSVEIKSGLSLEQDIKPILEANCAVAECHVAGTDLPNYNNNSTIISLAANIKARTGERSMPPPNSGRSLTDDEIAKIACWVDDGAPDN